jgi:magnesium transporter
MTVDERLALGFVARHPEDAARVLERADAADAAAVLESVPPDVAAPVYRALNPSSAATCAAALREDALVAIVEALPLDAASAALRRVERDRRERVLERLTETRRRHLASLLAYPEHTAGALADPLVLALTEDITVAEAQKQLRGGEQHLFYYVYVVARDRRLVGVLAMPELMAAKPRALLSAVMRRGLVTLDAGVDLPTVAKHPAWSDLDALPVVDSAGTLVGAIRHKAIRQLAVAERRPITETIVNLSELYWVGLAGMLATLAPSQAGPTDTESGDVT